MLSIKVSIIIPVYNVEQYLDECVQSVLCQSYTNLEIILVDDGSPDNCGVICDELAKLDSRIVVIHQENGGLSAARNAGLRIVTGDYVNFVDSDDRLFPHSIETLVVLARKYPGVDIVQGNIQQQDGRNDLAKACLTESEYIADPMRVSDGLISHFPQMAQSKLIRTSLLKDNDIEFLEGIIHEDEMFRWSLHTCAKSICFTKEFTYWYRMYNEASIMNDSDKTKSLCSFFTIVRNVFGSLKTRKEYKFVLFCIGYQKKIVFLPLCKNKKKVYEEIDKLRKMDIPFWLKAELFLWHLPDRLLNFQCIMFPYRVFRKCGCYIRYRK